MRPFVVADKSPDPWWRFALWPTLYLSWDRRDRVLALGLELWGAYAEVCLDLSGEG